MIDINVGVYMSDSDTTVYPMVRVMLDQIIVPTAICQSILEARFQGRLDQGRHVIEVLIDPDVIDRSAEIMIDRVLLQNVQHNFRDYGHVTKRWCSDPIYHYHQISKDSRWILEFDVPIYRWMHQKMNLGWLL